MSTPIHTLHPRRLFCSEAAEVDATSCLRPSVIAQQERMQTGASPFYVQPLLAPSPIPSSGLTLDVDTLTDFVNGLNAFASDEQACCGQVKLKQLEPLRDALIALQRRLAESSSTIVGVTPLLTPKKEQIVQKQPISLEEVGDPPEPSQTSFRGPASIVNSSVTSDVEHLRTIQKALRGLFDKQIVNVTTMSHSSLSPIQKSSAEDPDHTTATRISRALNDSGTVMSSVNCGDLANLTLSPTTELFDRESIQRNPWFKHNPGNKRNVLPATREIPFDSSKTAQALQNACVGAASKPSSNGTRNDLIQWLQKQANSKCNPSTSAKGLASIYTNRSKANFQDPQPDGTPLYRN